MSDEKITAYCFRCRETRGMVKTEESVTKTQMKIIKGRCSVCDAGMSRIIGKIKNESTTDGD